MKQRKNIGAFCETYGNTIENQILEYFLENQDLDIAVGDMAKELRISRPKAYEVSREFEKKCYIKKSRIVGKTQLYILNKDNIQVKLFLRNFNECLKLVIEKHGEQIKHEKCETCGNIHVGPISAKNI